MTHVEIELNGLRNELIHMWSLTYSQLEYTRDALISFDQHMAREVIQREKRVNGYELKNDTDCENILSKYHLTPNDLRFLLAALKINYNLERIGDYAKGIARYIISFNAPFNNDILKDTQLFAMFEKSIIMVADALSAFKNEDTLMARTIFQKDETLDLINKSASRMLQFFVENDINNLQEALLVHSIIQKLERIGDQTKNISEEIIFYLEAKVLKHGGIHK